ncbi:MAG: DUF1287 domain-containing protein [Pseudomonadota bacterium]
MKSLRTLSLGALLGATLSFAWATPVTAQSADTLSTNIQAATPQAFGDQIAAAALERTRHDVHYDSAYVRLAYPGGDVPKDRGVCSDVVVRSLRVVGIDLQKVIHEDMARHFNQYPKIWGATGPDHNIDHRRVPNIERYLTREGKALAVSNRSVDFKPGDIVAWNLRGDAGYLAHIGIVSDVEGPSGALMVVHNIGNGPELEDVLFLWPMTGHYRL